MSYTDYDFPGTHMYDSDLREVLAQMKQLREIVNTFVVLNTVTFADPIQWIITTQYAKNTIVLDTNGNAYLSKEAVPAGILLTNEDYWLEIFNYLQYVRSFNSNLTFNIEYNTTKATRPYTTGSWIILDDILYAAILDIDVDDEFEINTNIERFTVEQFCRTWKDYLVNLVNQYKADIDASEAQYKADIDASELQYKNEIDASELAYRNQLAQDIADTTASLQAQLDLAISGATVDSEVINARLGADGITYSTLGDAIRTQVGLLNNISGASAVKNLFFADNATAGKYVTDTGSLGTNANFSASDYIPVKEGKTYRLFNMADNNALIGAPGVFADASKTTFTSILSTSPVNKAKERIITVPSNCCYIRLSFLTADVDKYYLAEIIDDDILAVIADGMPDSALRHSENILHITEIKDAYISAGGAEQPLTGFTYTDFIAIDPYSIYTIVDPFDRDGSQLPAAGYLYDSNKQNAIYYTAPLHQSITKDGHLYYTFYTNNKAYIRVNAYAPYVKTMQLYKGFPVFLDTKISDKVDLTDIVDNNIFVSNGITDKYWNGTQEMPLDGFGYTKSLPIKPNTKYVILNIKGSDHQILGTPGFFVNTTNQQHSIMSGWETSSDDINSYCVVTSGASDCYMILNYYKDYVDVMAVYEEEEYKLLDSLCLGHHALKQVTSYVDGAIDDAIDALIHDPTKKVAFLGDSMGTGPHSTKKYWQIIHDETEWICLDYNKGGTGYCTTYGTDGNFNETVEDIASDVDCIVVFGGTNDYGNNGGVPMGTESDSTTATFYGGVNKLFDTLDTDFPNANKLVITPIRRADLNGGDTPNTQGSTLGDYVNAIKKRAAVYAYPVVDLYTVSQLSPYVNATNKDTYFYDNVHPNNAGQAKMSKPVLAALREIM